MVSGYEGICVSDDARNYQATGFIDREESLSGTYHPLQICTTGGSCMPVLHSLNRSQHMSPTMELKSYLLCTTHNMPRQLYPCCASAAAN
jgi:hypothetical protein